MFKSIRSKLVFAFCCFLAGFVLLQMIFSVFFAEKFYILQKKSEINRVYSELGKYYSDSHDELYKILNKYEEKYNLRVIIFQKDEASNKANFIYANVPDWQINERDLFHAPFKFVEEKMQFSKNAKAQLFENKERDAKTIILNGVAETDRGDRYIFIESPVASIQQTVDVTAKINFWLLLALLTVGIVYFCFFANRLTKPIMEIDEVAKSVVKLDFSKKATETGGKDEISHLATNINIMSDRISNMIFELTEANKRLEKDIELKTKLENIRKEFVANVSHELKTPIALLMGYTEMLKADVPDLDKDFYYDVIADESNKMNKLVTQLLDISRMENELADLKLETVDLYDLVLWTIEKNKLHFEQNNLIYDFHGERILYECDKLKIEQAITNYISNAIFHSPKKSKIKIWLYRENGRVVFSVYNEGKRISEEDAEKIWNIFYKADKSRSERKSTGLGLYIVSSVINAHKGEYGVKNVDNGVLFYFKI